MLGGFLSHCCPDRLTSIRVCSTQMKEKVTTEGSQEIRHCSRHCFWSIKYNPIGTRAPVSAKHFPRRAQGGLQGWTTGRKKCTNGSKMRKLCQVQTKIICVPLFMPLQKALLCLWERIYMWTWSRTQPLMLSSGTRSPRQLTTASLCPQWHAGPGEMSSCMLAEVTTNTDVQSETFPSVFCPVFLPQLVAVQGSFGNVQGGPVMSLWMTVRNQICLTAHKTPVWFTEVRPGGEFKSLFQGDCLFIWTILWTKIEMSISHEECYPLGMQMSLGCLRDQLLAVPASLPISLHLPLPSYVCLAAMDLESAEAHAEQFSILKPQQINLSTENKFSSKQIRPGDWRAFCAGSDSHQKVVEASM